MTSAQLKDAVIQKLADDRGVWVNRHLPMRVLCQKVEQATGQPKPYRQTIYDYLHGYASPPKAEPPFVRPWRDLSTRQHLRAAEIDRLPRPIGMPGIGNGGEGGYGRGR